ncbi:MAG: hypothetical protein JWP61_1954 [Friedmanniella sp.]|nr:hypothetical protein [Friedmanniella sp.]
MSAPSIDLRRAGQRFLTRTDRGESRHAFSFGQHYAPDNVGFGPLMVHNDERLDPGPGYDDHPHADAEILTWVLSGSLVHEDSSGNRGVVHPGLAQRMTAGSGIVHAERNDAYRLDPTRAAEPVHFVQMWLRPDAPGGPPSYQQQVVDLAALNGDWVPVASGARPDAAVTLGTQDATLWVTRLGAGERRRLPTASLVHAYVAAGEVEVETLGLLRAGDAVRVRGEAALEVTGRVVAELLVWAMGR